jgi:Ca2+-binding RTX toxin-like protein
VDSIEIRGTLGADTLIGSSEADVVSGAGGTDTLDGNGGDDLFLFFASPGAGTTISGDGGIDTIALQNITTFDFTQTSLGGIERLEIRLPTIEAILTGTQIGSGGITTVVGSGGFSPGGPVPDRLVVAGDFIDLTPVAFQIWQADDEIRLIGTAGLDNLTGSSQIDRIEGGDSVDILDGGAGNDTMIGGAGNDDYFAANGDILVEGAAEGDNDRVFAASDYVLTAANVETVALIGAAVAATGNGQNNTIFGNGQNNVINGGGNSAVGGDSLVGLDGNDTFFFQASQAQGDTIFDFTGNGAAAGDFLQFSGYGTAAAGATFVNLGGNDWQINSADGLIHEVIVVIGAVDASDFIFT